jgi:Rab-GTPase-TBC domain
VPVVSPLGVSEPVFRLLLVMNLSALLAQPGTADLAANTLRLGACPHENPRSSLGGARGVVWARLLRLDCVCDRETKCECGGNESALEDLQQEYAVLVSRTWLKLDVPAVAEEGSSSRVTNSGLGAVPPGSLTESSMNRLEKDDVAVREQVRVDIPRIAPHSSVHQKLFDRDARLRESIERVLYSYDQEFKDAGGYFQGLGDIAVVFFLVNLAQFVDIEEVGDDSKRVGISDLLLHRVESDTFWGLTRFLEPFRETLSDLHSGIGTMTQDMMSALQKTESEVVQHLRDLDIDALIFAIRWMICLLTRELPFGTIVRIFDVYVAAESVCADSVPLLHPIVCAEMLRRFRSQVLECDDFTTCVQLLQDLPSSSWDHSEGAACTDAALRHMEQLVDDQNDQRFTGVRELFELLGAEPTRDQLETA